MQIIVVSRHMKSARTLTIMPRHVVGALFGFATLVLLSAIALSWLSLHFRLPIVEDLLLSVERQANRETRSYIANNLQLMATRLGELQGRMLQLDTLGERVSDLAGLKARKPEPETPRPGEGGPYVPAPLTVIELQQEIERLAYAVDRQTDDLSYVEFSLLEKRVEQRVLPTTLPVPNAVLGSAFGFRSDPFAGTRARHEGLDFNAPPGSPVVAAADGVVQTASYHAEYGNMIELDHGEGLVSRYAHLQSMGVEPGRIVRRGEQIGALGNTGRSTGPHLHFEVRMLGVPQNPANFLKRGEQFASVKRR